MAETLPQQHSGTPVSDAQLRQFRIFNDVDLNSIRPLLDSCPQIQLQTGDILLRPECVNDAMYLLLGGRVAVSLESAGATPLVELGRGECIGEMSVFDGHNPSAYVTAMEPCQVLVVESRVLWQLINHSHSLSRNLLYFLSNRLRSGNDILALSKSREKAQEKAANVDALTGVNNRRWLQEVMDSLAGSGLREKLPLAVLMLDVDHFKHFNDTYGHKSGDRVLQMVARTMRRSLRPSDMLARYGGEEFIILLPTTPARQARAVAERLRKSVAACEVTAEQGQALPSVTISVGLALVTGDETIEQAVEAADRALYQAKHNGRNRVQVYQSES